MLTEYQHKIRGQGITGSEVAAICGVYPWAGPIDVYASKLYQKPPIEWKDNDGLIRGTLFEAPVLQWYAIKTSRTVVGAGEYAKAACDTLVHPELPIVIATPDGVSLGGPDDAPMVVEAKCPGWRMGVHWGEEGSDAIPDYYRPQVIWEMAVTGLRAAHVVAYLGDAPKIYYVPWDQDLFDTLYEVAARFWHDNVLSRVPPPVDGTQGYSEWIARQLPANTLSDYRPMDDTVRPWVEKLRQMRVMQERIEAEAREARQHIELYIGEHAGVDCGGLGRIDWKKNKDSKKVDWRKLCADKIGADNEDLTPYTKTQPGARPFTPRFAKEA